jgi:hypothetical protein
MSEKLLDIKGLSECLGSDVFPVRTIRSLKASGKIPFLKLGHRTLRFSASKVLKALENFEIREVPQAGTSSKRSHSQTAQMKETHSRELS